MVRKSRTLSAVLMAGDAAALVTAVMAAYWFRFQTTFFVAMPQQNQDMYQRLAALVAFVGVVILYLSGGYRIKGRVFDLESIYSLIKSVTITYAIALVVSFSLRGVMTASQADAQSRLVLGMAWLISIVSVMLWRATVGHVIRYYRMRGLGLSQVLVVGTDAAALRFVRVLDENPRLGFSALGYLQVQVDGDAEAGDRCLGSIDDLEHVIKRRWIDQVVVSLPEVDPERLTFLMDIAERADIQFSMIPQHLEILTSKRRLSEIGGIPIITMEESQQLRRNRAARRILNIVLASSLVLAMLPVLLPLTLILTLLIKLDSTGSVFFRQQRVGKGGRPFWLYKFRSMVAEAELLKTNLSEHNEAEGALFKMRDDPRVTRIGRHMRRLSLDELPQLINVFAGDMNLVGPRPPLLDEVVMYEPWQMKRFDVLPGMVGLPQVSGRSDLTFDEVIRLDLYYIENWSPLLDLKVLLRTVPVVLSGRGAY
jgi:exopolysaccharide biosynthesis polyprenyl glycosylphosphotransferase